MSTWITKDLTLDLLAITIDGLNKIFNRIKDTPDGWPAEEAKQVEAPAPTPVAAVVDDTPEWVNDDPAPAAQAAPAAPAPAAEPAPAAAPLNRDELIPTAQTALRAIAQKEGPDWITTSLFPHFKTESLLDVPTDQLPNLIHMAEYHLQGAA